MDPEQMHDRFSHAMPFGAAVTERGVRFRLWAPAASTVDVRLGSPNGPELIPMSAMGTGWFELVTPAAHAGMSYAFRIDGDREVADPASRHQLGDVHGPSVVVDPEAFVWRNGDWCGRPWHESVLYELHVGTFSSEGTFDGVQRHLDHLVETGVTAIELMPIADFTGGRNWGYDGVLPYAPAKAYGSPEDLKRLVDAAHGRGLMVFLDVVYNHFGPDGNYLHLYAPQFFTTRFDTPWGAAIDFSRREVRDFFIHNTLYWLEEYRFDGLRFDAVHAIIDETAPDILEELALTVHRQFGDQRHIHLVLENEHNEARYLERGHSGRPRYYTAQWNDDIHHAFHVLATGESVSYYRDYVERPVDLLGRCLAEGFAYQGEAFRHRGGEARGEPSAHLPATAFVSFIQNHDQVGNRAFGERLSVLAEPEVLKPLIAIMLLAPSPPLLFMGEEWGSVEPFLFFCDFHDELADSVREGRRREFAQFPEFEDAAAREKIPDPNSQDTFQSSKLDWGRRLDPGHKDLLARYRDLLQLRHAEIIPRLAGLKGNAASWIRFGKGGLVVTWRLGDGSSLALLANLSSESCSDLPAPPQGRLLHATQDGFAHFLERSELPPWFAAWVLD